MGYHAPSCRTKGVNHCPASTEDSCDRTCGPDSFRPLEGTSGIIGGACCASYALLGRGRPAAGECSSIDLFLSCLVMTNITSFLACAALGSISGKGLSSISRHLGLAYKDLLAHLLALLLTQCLLLLGLLAHLLTQCLILRLLAHLLSWS